MKNYYAQLSSIRNAIPIAVLILFSIQTGFISLAGSSFGQANPITIPLSNSLPFKIITADGQAYGAVKLLRVLPDGLLIEYQPVSGGMGLATLKFKTLSESLQKQFGYDQKKASSYEKDQALGMAELSQKLRQDEKIKTATLVGLARASVFVQAESPTVVYKYYDRTGTKPPQLSDEWKGNASYHLKCDVDFTFHFTQNATNESFVFGVETTTIALGLTTTIILPDGENGKLKDHEEGHRKIDEFFYSLGPQAAQHDGELMTGKEFTSYAKNFESAKIDFLARARHELQTEYNKHTKDVCVQANKYYDELTNHGRNDIDSEAAAQKAIRHYEP